MTSGLTLKSAEFKELSGTQVSSAGAAESLKLRFLKAFHGCAFTYFLASELSPRSSSFIIRLYSITTADILSDIKAMSPSSL
ncbi:hypothetical protein LINPERHAP2_LOCUS5399 [Linum perenne]